MQNSFQFMISIIFSRIIKMELLRGLLILKSGGKNISSHGQKIGMPYTFSFFLNSFGWNLISHEKLQSRWISSKLIKKEQTKSLILKATMGTFIFYPDFMLCLTVVVHLTSFEKKIIEVYFGNVSLVKDHLTILHFSVLENFIK